MSKTKLEKWCSQQGWTEVKFEQDFIDEYFDQLMSVLTGQYCIIPTFMRGYDDPMSSKIFFQLPSDAQAFKAKMNIVTTTSVGVVTGSVVGYFNVVQDADGFTEVVIIDKAAIDSGQLINADEAEERVEGNLPEGFYPTGECCYEHEYDSNDEAKEALIACGFEEKTNMIFTTTS